MVLDVELLSARDTEESHGVWFQAQVDHPDARDAPVLSANANGQVDNEDWDSAIWFFGEGLGQLSNRFLFQLSAVAFNFTIDSVGDCDDLISLLARKNQASTPGSFRQMCKWKVWNIAGQSA
jgi:hypothetical protein